MTKTLKNDYKLKAFLDFNKNFTVAAAKWLLQQLLKNAIQQSYNMPLNAAMVATIESSEHARVIIKAD